MGAAQYPRSIAVIDGLLAASAKVRGCTLVTRNTADLQHSGIALLNPFEPPPAT
jgi:predicted nucleic acid-binding protein